VKTLLLSLLLLSGCSTLPEHEQAAAADGGLTILGLVLGAAELNPLGLLTIPLKYGMVQHVKTLPDGERQEAESTMTAYFGGLSVNNACVVLAILTGGTFGVACLVIGAAYGLNKWNAESTQRAFWHLCTEEKVARPDLSCEWKS